MPHHALLNNIDHKDLRIRTGRGAAYGDAVMFAPTFPAEFRELQAHYPIVFRQTADAAGFEPLALFGLQDGENLFLSQQGWDAAYVPLMLARQPFLIGINGDQLMVHVDLDSPRIAGAGGDGEPVFLPHGGTTDYLEQVNSTLLAIHHGLQATPAFVAALREHDLLEPFVLDIELDDGSRQRLAGFHTINEDRLAALDGAALARLHRPGHLQAIYLALASLSHLRALIGRRNRAAIR